MNNFCRKDITILVDAFTDRCASSRKPLTKEEMKQIWSQCEYNYLERLGLNVTQDIDPALKGSKCQAENCTVCVTKPKPIDGKIFCYRHRNQYIKTAKNEVRSCLHVFTGNSKYEGMRCTSKTVNEQGYCVRHQKKTPRSSPVPFERAEGEPEEITEEIKILSRLMEQRCCV